MNTSNVDVSASDSSRAQQLQSLLDAVCCELDSPPSASDARRFMTHLVWHESDQCRTREQYHGPARGLPQFEAHRAKDALEYALQHRSNRPFWSKLVASARTTAATLTDADLEAAVKLLPMYGNANSAAYPAHNLILRLLTSNDYFGLTLLRIALKKVPSALPVASTGDAEYWARHWKQANVTEAETKRFIASAARIDQLLNNGAISVPAARVERTNRGLAKRFHADPIGTRRKIEDDVVAMARRDPNFYARLLADPKGTLSEFLDHSFRSRLRITVLEETEDQIYLLLPHVLPPDPAVRTFGVNALAHLAEGGPSMTICGPGAPSLPKGHSCYAVLYEHRDFGGDFASFLEGDHFVEESNGGGIDNDTASSLIVGADAKVVLAEHKEGTGRTKEFGPGNHAYVGDDFNDCCSFVRVIRIR